MDWEEKKLGFHLVKLSNLWCVCIISCMSLSNFPEFSSCWFDRTFLNGRLLQPFIFLFMLFVSLHLSDQRFFIQRFFYVIDPRRLLKKDVFLEKTPNSLSEPYPDRTTTKARLNWSKDKKTDEKKRKAREQEDYNGEQSNPFLFFLPRKSESLEAPRQQKNKSIQSPIRHKRYFYQSGT